MTYFNYKSHATLSKLLLTYKPPKNNQIPYSQVKSIFSISILRIVGKLCR